MRKGLLTPEQETILAEMVEKAIDSDNPIIEVIDDYIPAIGIRAIDDLLLDRISLELRKILIPLVDLAFTGAKVQVLQAVNQAQLGRIPALEAVAVKTTVRLCDFVHKMTQA